MGDLYVAIATLTFGLLVENTLFQTNLFQNFGSGIAVNTPSFISNPRVMAYFCIAIFVVVALLITNLRRSTSGLGLTAVRSSVVGSRTLGISVVQMKVILAGITAFVAGIGGGLLAVTVGVALPSTYTTLGGEVWLAVLVTQGIRSNGAAMAAGLGNTMIAGLLVAYAPAILGNILPVLFGLGAIGMVKAPEGLLTMQVRELRSALSTLRKNQPRLYNLISAGSAAYFVIFVVLLIAVPHLWWVWSLITLVALNSGGGAVFFAAKERVARPSLQLNADAIAVDTPAPVQR
jgi:branched-chain amino acid transport system permease protein